jgi:hypothetical protein
VTASVSEQEPTSGALGSTTAAAAAVDGFELTAGTYRGTAAPCW